MPWRHSCQAMCKISQLSLHHNLDESRMKLPSNWYYDGKIVCEMGTDMKSARPHLNIKTVVFLCMGIPIIKIRPPYLYNGNTFTVKMTSLYWETPLATLPLTIFWSNLQLHKNMQCSGLKCTLPITTKFCTCQDSVTVVTCAKFCCDWLRLF